MSLTHDYHNRRKVEGDPDFDGKVKRVLRKIVEDSQAPLESGNITKHQVHTCVIGCASKWP